MNIKGAVSSFLRVMVSVVLISVLVYVMRDSLPGMIAALKRASPALFILSAAIYFAAMVISSMRLRILLSLQGIDIAILDVFRINLIGCFFSSFLPTSIGGDVVKAYYISRHSGKNTQSYTSVFTDRFLGMFTIFLIALVSVFFIEDSSGLHLIWLLPALVITSLLFIAILYNKKLAKKFLFPINLLIPKRLKEGASNAYNAVHNYKNHKREIAECFALSVIGQIAAFSSAYFLAQGIGSYISLKLALLVMPVASIVSMLPSINGVGPREMSIVIILRQFIGESAAGAVAILWLGIILMTSIAGGIVYMLMGYYKMSLPNLANNP